MLEKIIAYKKEQLKEIKTKVPYEALKKQFALLDQACKDFAGGLKKDKRVTLIAEVKKASPSRGIIRKDFNPLEIAKIYTRAGVDAISVLTEDKFFMGSLENLKTIRLITDLPLLRKDFIIDPYQIFEARVSGADAILLIARILEKTQLKAFIELAQDLGMATLVEVHNEQELEEVLQLPVKLIGINNRNLATFKTDIYTTFRLRDLIEDESITIVSESGIKNYTDVIKLHQNKIDAMLVGETFMRNENIEEAISSLTGRRLA